MSTRAGFNAFVNSNIGFLNDSFPKGMLKLFLVLYAGMAAPKLSDDVLVLFSNDWFKLAVLFLVLWTGNNDPSLSLLIAVAFTVTLTTLSTREGFFGYRDSDRFLECSAAHARAKANIDNAMTPSQVLPCDQDSDNLCMY